MRLRVWTQVLCISDGMKSLDPSSVRPSPICSPYLGCVCALLVTQPPPCLCRSWQMILSR